VGGAPDGPVYRLEVIDPDGDGAQPARLSASGNFTSIGGIPARYAAAWDGQAWAALGDNLSPSAAGSSVAAFDPDGPGPEPADLYTTGAPEGSRFIEWPDSVARLDGDQWREMAGGLRSYLLGAGVNAMAAFDPDPSDGAPPVLMCAGNIDWHLQTWDGLEFAQTGAELCCSDWHYYHWGPYVWTTTVFAPAGSPPRVVIGGWIQSVNGTETRGVASWDGAAWSPLPGLYGDSSVLALLPVDLDGDGPEPLSLLAAGFYLQGSLEEKVTIAIWNGQAWSPWDAGLTRTSNPSVAALALVDHAGPGHQPPSVYAAGKFLFTDDPASANIARWEVDRWVPLGSGLLGPGLALGSHDPDGPGPEAPVLIAGGDFAQAGGLAAAGIARWDGESWSALGDGVNGEVRALASYAPPGRTPLLYAGGEFSVAGDVAASNVAAWDGQAWSALGSGTDGPVMSLFIHDDDGPDGSIGPALYVGGRFRRAGGLPSDYLARWGDLTPACYADCNTDGSLDFFDFVCFINLFNTADPAADCDGSGGLDIFDFLCFVNEYNAGC
jgi:hypothetical protein